MKIQLNHDLHKNKKGDVIDLSKLTGSELTYWKSRIKDSEIDQCVSLVEDGKPAYKEEKYSQKNYGKKGGK